MQWRARDGRRSDEHRRRALPRRAAAALLPDRRLAPGRRGSRAGDAAGRVARAWTASRSALDAHVAVPDRDEPLPEPAARPRAARPPPAAPAVAGADAPSPSRCGCDPSPGPRATRRARRSGSPSSTAPAAPAAAPARGARAARRARLPRRRGGRDARDLRGPRWRARCTGRARRPPSRATRRRLPGSREERALVARFTEAFERGDVDGVVALLTADARLTMPPYAARVRRAGGDPRGSCPRSRPAATSIAGAARADARQRAARVRLLPARPHAPSRRTGSWC